MRTTLAKGVYEQGVDGGILFSETVINRRMEKIA
jgi:hypothetical protein